MTRRRRCRVFRSLSQLSFSNDFSHVFSIGLMWLKWHFSNLPVLRFSHIAVFMYSETSVMVNGPLYVAVSALFLPMTVFRMKTMSCLLNVRLVLVAFILSLLSSPFAARVVFRVSCIFSMFCCSCSVYSRMSCLCVRPSCRRSCGCGDVKPNIASSGE